ncbi:MAG: MarR family transcriptional regulator [Deltaproteobacteria bacterium]|nr:MarR family transcriptional regulator [Deltaproteobacteria bacterium]MCW5804874.1 MarR family transcriptional regulator [Deltaproteobacteria bacterium]
MALSRSVPHLTRLTRRVYANATPEVLGMNLKQVSMLAALRDEGDLPQTTLCDMMRTTQNTVVTWLNELEDAGFVSRQRDPSDRRKHNVTLTAHGTTALERAETELRRLEDEVLTGLTVDERTQLRRLLAKALEAGDGDR